MFQIFAAFKSTTLTLYVNECGGYKKGEAPRQYMGIVAALLLLVASNLLP
jgi:hypothetical protein